MTIPQPNDLTRVGVMIERCGTWRETVIRYAGYKHLEGPCLYRYDVLVNEGMMEPWAALKALDEHCCADVVMDKSHMGIETYVDVN